MSLWNDYCKHESLVDFHAEVEKALRAIEEKHQVKVLLAADTGSRSCSLHSYGSDLDVHFVFLHANPRRYLSLSPIKDSLEYSTAFSLPDFEGVDPAKTRIEVNCSGWELKRACSLLLESNAALVDLLFLSQSPELGYRHDLNPFKDILGTHFFNFRKLGLHFKSTGNGVMQNKIQGQTGPIPVKNYLNFIRYTNLAQQIKVAMEASQSESNKYSGISATSYQVLPQKLQDFQKAMLQKRRSMVWDTERDSEVEQILVSMVEVQHKYFIEFKDIDPSNSKKVKDLLSKDLNDICYRILHELISTTGIAAMGLGGEEGQVEQ